MPGPVELSSVVAQTLREHIVSGVSKPGERLIETELAEQFGTSRGPIRDAFKELEQVGLVHTKPRRGTFVARFDTKDIFEIYTLRQALETTAVQLAASNNENTDSAAADLEATLAALSAAYKNGDRRTMSEADLAFHRLIVNLSGQRRLLEAWERVADQTLVLLGELSSHRPDIGLAISEHRRVAKFVTDNDADGASEALSAHLKRGCSSMITRRRSTT